MFCVFTLPWYCKASVVAYDVFRCLLHASQPTTGRVVDNIVSVFALQSMIAVLLLAP